MKLCEDFFKNITFFKDYITALLPT